MPSDLGKWLTEIEHELQIAFGVTIEELPEFDWHFFFNNDYTPIATLNQFFKEDIPV